MNKDETRLFIAVAEACLEDGSLSLPDSCGYTTQQIEDALVQARILEKEDDDPSRDHNLVCATYKRDKYDRIAKSGPDAWKYRKETEYLQIIVDNDRPIHTGRGSPVLELNRVMFLSGWNLDRIMPASGISQDY